MKWQCWKCSSDDGCELVDLVGGDPVHEPDTCPWGKSADWKRVEESAAEENKEAGQPATNTQSTPCSHNFVIDNKSAGFIYADLICRKCGYKTVSDA